MCLALRQARGHLQHRAVGDKTRASLFVLVILLALVVGGIAGAAIAKKHLITPSAVLPPATRIPRRSAIAKKRLITPSGVLPPFIRIPRRSALMDVYEDPLYTEKKYFQLLLKLATDGEDWSEGVKGSNWTREVLFLYKATDYKRDGKDRVSALYGGQSEVTVRQYETLGRGKGMTHLEALQKALSIWWNFPIHS